MTQCRLCHTWMPQQQQQTHIEHMAESRWQALTCDTHRAATRQRQVDIHSTQAACSTCILSLMIRWDAHELRQNSAGCVDYVGQQL